MNARSVSRAPFVVLALSAAIGCASGSPSNGDSGSTSGSGGSGGNGGTGKTTLSLPQFVHGAARVDTAAYVNIPLVVETAGTKPDDVEVSIGSATTKATADGDRFVAE